MSPGSPLQGKTILIIDDDRSMGEMLKQAITEQTSHRAIWIAESDLVLESARHLRPSLILLDYVMPMMNGLRLYDYLRQVENTRDVPVILISGSVTLPFEELRVRGIHILKKPFDLNDLLDLIAQLMPGPPTVSE
jgi:CheY-like chemotaxis protein